MGQDYRVSRKSVERSIILELKKKIRKAKIEGDKDTEEKCRVALNNYSVTI